MSVNYESPDVLKLVETMIRPSRPDPVSGYRPSYVHYIKSVVSDTLAADPDVVLWLMGLVSRRIATAATELLVDTTSILENLPIANRPTSAIDIGGLEDIRAGLAKLKSGTLGARVRGLSDLKAKTIRLAGSYARQGDTTVTKDQETIRREIFFAAQRVLSNVAVISEYIGLFDDAPDDFSGSGLFLSSVTSQVEAVERSLSEILSGSSSDSAATLVAVAAGLGVISAATVVKSPIGPKYSGPITILPGTPAKVTSTISLPFAGVVNTTAIASDSESGLLNIPASLHPSISLVPEVGYEPIPGSEWVTVFPILAPSQMRVLVDNTEYTLTVNTNITSISDLRTKISAAAITAGAPVTFSGTGDYLPMTYVGTRYGSASRIALYDDDGVGGGSDLHSVLGLNFVKYGETTGVDTGYSELYLSGYVASEPILDSLDTEIRPSQVTPANLGLSGGFTVVPLPVGHSAIPGDVAHIRGTTYHITGVTATSATLDNEVLHVFDGAVLTDPTTTTALVRITRCLVTVTSPSSISGTTSIAAVAGVLGFPTTQSVGWHDLFSLAGPSNDTSPIRVGDVVIGSAGASMGSVTDLRGSAIRLASPVTLSAATVGIESLGASTYRYVGPRMVELRQDIADLSSPELLVRDLLVAAGSPTVSGPAYSGVAAIRALSQDAIDVVASYRYNTPQSGVDMLRSLREDGHILVATLLAKCRFSEINDLKPGGESQETQMHGKLSAISASISGVAESLMITRLPPDSEYESTT